MENKKRFFVICFIFFTILGSLLHFAYDVSNSKFIGLFTPVNESIWEHFKLILVPATLFIFLLMILKKDMLNSSILSLCFSVIISCIFIYLTQITYTYMGFEHSITFSIISYILAMALCFYLIYILGTNTNLSNTNALGAILLFLMYMLVIALTINPPYLEIFRDSVTNSYGIYKITPK